jgi:hypothetical protein
MAQKALSYAFVTPGRGSAGMRLSGRLTPRYALAAQDAQSEALNLAPNNSLEPTRPARRLALARY